MTICALQELLSDCAEPTWSADGSVITLTTLRPLQSSFLRSFESYRVFPQSLQHATETTLQADYDARKDRVIPIQTTLQVSLPRVVTRAVVVKNLNDLLSIHSATRQHPPEYFVVKEEESERPFCYIGQASLASAPKKIVHYHQAIQLWALIQQRADHITADNSVLFFGMRRIELSAQYGPDDLNQEVAVAAIEAFVTNEEANDTRLQIFRSVLSDHLKDQPRERAFSYLLRQSQLFAQRLAEGLAIYLSEHSPEKLSEKAIAKHFELAEKLEKVIGGMEAKSLTIPAAVLLATKEVTFGGGWITLNTVIFISTVVYFAAMTVAHLSQLSMLGLLKKTISKAKLDLKEQGLDENNIILAESFRNLDKRSKNYTIASWLIWIFSIGPMLAVFYGVMFATPALPKDHSKTTDKVMVQPLSQRHTSSKIAEESANP